MGVCFIVVPRATPYIIGSIVHSNTVAFLPGARVAHKRGRAAWDAAVRNTLLLLHRNLASMRCTSWAIDKHAEAEMADGALSLRINEDPAQLGVDLTRFHYLINILSLSGWNVRSLGIPRAELADSLRSVGNLYATLLAELGAGNAEVVRRAATAISQYLDSAGYRNLATLFKLLAMASRSRRAARPRPRRADARGGPVALEYETAVSLGTRRALVDVAFNFGEAYLVVRGGNGETLASYVYYGQRGWAHKSASGEAVLALAIKGLEDARVFMEALERGACLLRMYALVLGV